MLSVPFPLSCDLALHCSTVFCTVVYAGMHAYVGHLCMCMYVYVCVVTCSLTVRDHVMKNWMKTSSVYYAADPKRVYYISLEFYMGRTLTNTMMALGIMSETRKALYVNGNADRLDDGERERERDRQCMCVLCVWRGMLLTNQPQPHVRVQVPDGSASRGA